MKKRKIFTVVLIFSMLMATLAGCDKADKVSDTTKKPVIKIGSDNYPPYNFPVSYTHLTLPTIA